MLKRGTTKTTYPSIPTSVSMWPSPCVCAVCVYLCVAVQKMAEAHMQSLGVYPPLEDPCEGEEDEERWQGEDMSPTKAAGERKVLCQLGPKQQHCTQLFLGCKRETTPHSALTHLVLWTDIILTGLVVLLLFIFLISLGKLKDKLRGDICH